MSNKNNTSIVFINFKNDESILSNNEQIVMKDCGENVTTVFKETANTLTELVAKVRGYGAVRKAEFEMVQNYTRSVTVGDKKYNKNTHKLIANDEIKLVQICTTDKNAIFLLVVLENEAGLRRGVLRHRSMRNEAGVIGSKIHNRAYTSTSNWIIAGENEGKTGETFNIAFFSAFDEKKHVKWKLNNEAVEAPVRDSEKQSVEIDESHIMAMIRGVEKRLRDEFNAKLEAKDKEIAELKVRLEAVEIKTIDTTENPVSKDVVADLQCEIQIASDFQKATNKLNAKLERRDNGQRLSGDDIQVILRGDMKEINAKFAPKGVFASKINEAQVDELMHALEADTNETVKAANDDVAASAIVSDEYLKELDALLAM
ncbi:hypothetical protein IGX09_000665 [Shigella sonnei]|nr:hypothetical protein [Shigella sonnei]EIB4458280.1 hypothetical protein [Shigella sonnei]EIM5036486.1 hypothetical protein [Shigella sonnei]EIN2597460.1 hypothetical protein [Shigella sonnei]